MGGVEALRAALADRYAIQREVGHGAMATVYLARDLRFARDVAIKVLSPDFSAALGTERFLREIDVVAKLNHPHILPLLDSGKAGGFLYYVMPYVEGSLRNRLVKETQLRIDEAIALTREIALALDYAHREGIVHRDVKPENILLSRGYALLGDFGIARVLSPAEVERLTNTGASPGTPAYMSPEQCGGGGTLDGRSDLYSLGCVVYELLAGTPPFTGPSAQAIAARHLTDPVPPLRTVRRTVPEGLERVVLRVLEKVPADRYATGAEFASALAAPEILLPVPTPWWRRFSKWKVAAALAAVAFGGAVAVRTIPGLWTDGASGLDSTRYAILPVERDSGLVSFNEDQLLQDAMLKWSGISVVDRSRLLEALPRSRARLTSTDAQAVAKRVGAGRYIVSQVSRLGDSLRVHSAVYATAARGPPIYESSAKIGLDRAQTVPAFSRIADRLLFGGSGPGASLDQPGGTTSRPARQAFELGLDSIYTWNLNAADSAFRVATDYDPSFAHAHLWLAQTRFWKDTVVATWRSSAERAAAGRQLLTERDRLLSDALSAFGNGDLMTACPKWQDVTRREPYTFSGWYGLATCLSQDDAVLHDPRTPSGWRFRSSFYRATKAYQRAFQLIPAVHKSLAADSYSSVRRLLMTGGSQLRPGRAVPPDTTTFVAYPSWQGDTLAFTPYHRQYFGGSKVVPEGMSLAVRRERELFHDIARSWVTASPQSGDAVWALAISLELLGDPTALDTVRRARALMTTPSGRLRAAGAEAWMLVKFSVPGDLPGLRTARAIADSLLRANPPSHSLEPILLASLATLTGRASLAAQFSRHPAVVADWGVPLPLSQIAGPLLVFAALGGPSDSLRELEEQTDSVIARQLPGPTRQRARLRWLGRPAALAFPVYRFESAEKLVGCGNYLVDAEAALRRGDSVALRRILADVQAARRFVLPGEVTLDAVYPETWLLASIGDPVAASAWLDPTLTALPNTAPEKLVDLANAGALVNAMALRAELAEHQGDQAAAARWARAVIVLWSDADPFLQARVRQMNRLAR